MRNEILFLRVGTFKMNEMNEGGRIDGVGGEFSEETSVRARLYNTEHSKLSLP